MSVARLVIGPGGTGLTTTVRTWADELADSGGEIVWLTGSPTRPVGVDRVERALASEPAVIVADDLQWFEADAAEALTTASVTVVASRRPLAGDEPAGSVLDEVDRALTTGGAAHRLGLLTVDDLAPVLAALRDDGAVVPSDDVTAIHHLSAGSVGLAADLVAGGWHPPADDLATRPIPVEVVDAVTARMRRSGPVTVALVRAWAVANTGPSGTDGGLDLALRMLDDGLDAGLAERAVRASGLIDGDGNLIPVVRLAALADLVAGERTELHRRAAAALGSNDPVAAAEHLVQCTGPDPDGVPVLARATVATVADEPGRAERYIDRAVEAGMPDGDAHLLRALAAYHGGRPEALTHLEQAAAAGTPVDERSSVLQFGLDLRDLRYGSAAERGIGGELSRPLRTLAAAMVGRTGHDDGARPDTPLGSVVQSMADAVRDLAQGRSRQAMEALSSASDDLDRLRPSTPLGLTPHQLGALCGLAVGDRSGAEVLLDAAIERGSGGAGEHLTHQLLVAYVRLGDGRYHDALALIRRFTPGAVVTDPDGTLDDEVGDDDASDEMAPVGDDDRLLPQRDRLLLAVLEAAIARRSGDTSRLRSAWKRAEAALIRPSVSWLLTDLLTELLATGARLGDGRRVGPIAAELSAQGLGLPDAGPGPIGARWLELQLALAAEDDQLVEAAARDLAGLTPGDDRGRARIAASDTWAGLVASEHPRPSADTVIAVAEQLTAVDDGWEASRLLGRAALDEADPKVARRLLELARISTTDQLDETSSDGLSALGLSDREAEVALLVAEGRTHKEIGAQLYISPKTVEHHVAKIRQKVGASSRAELLATIRDAVG